jgi:hypothetical protein
LIVVHNVKDTSKIFVIPAHKSECETDHQVKPIESHHAARLSSDFKIMLKLTASEVSNFDWRLEIANDDYME